MKKTVNVKERRKMQEEVVKASKVKQIKKESCMLVSLHNKDVEVFKTRA